MCVERNRRCVIDTWYRLNAASKNLMRTNTLTFKISGLMHRVRRELGKDIETATIRILVEDRSRVYSEWYISDFVHVNCKSVHPLTLCAAVTPKNTRQSRRSTTPDTTRRNTGRSRRSFSAAQSGRQSPQSVPLLQLKENWRRKRQKLCQHYNAYKFERIQILFFLM